MIVRRSRELAAVWTRNGLELGLPGVKSRYRLPWRLIQLLAECSNWLDISENDPRLRPDQLSFLLSSGLLVAEDCDESPTPDPFLHLGTSAHAFHAAARDANYANAGADRERLVQEIASQAEFPPLFKEYPTAPEVMLPRVIDSLLAPTGDVLRRRRTHRTFEASAMSLDELSTLLHYSFAPLRFVDASPFGTLQLRASPAAGSRHEVECYVVPRHVDGVERALYHYNAKHHSLELIGRAVTDECLADLTYNAPQLQTAAVICFTTAMLDRITAKYRHPRAYRLWLYNAGHYGQTFALVATALGLGAFQTAAFHDSRVETMLGIDGIRGSEFAAYVLAAGHPKLGQDTLPSDFKTARATINVQ